jgi:hypothetical protein
MKNAPVTDDLDGVRMRLRALIELLIASDFTEDQLAQVYRQLFAAQPPPLKPRTSIAWERLFGFGERGRRYLPRNHKVPGTLKYRLAT